ncbi:MAG: helix-turn-helix transcriptional regulator [Lachnospiraceae bacterium]
MKLKKTKVLLVMAERNMYQKDLAEAAGMSRGNLSTLVNGKNCQPKTAFKIAQALNVSVEEILED